MCRGPLWVSKIVFHVGLTPDLTSSRSFEWLRVAIDVWRLWEAQEKLSLRFLPQTVNRVDWPRKWRRSISTRTATRVWVLRKSRWGYRREIGKQELQDQQRDEMEKRRKEEGKGSTWKSQDEVRSVQEEEPAEDDVHMQVVAAYGEYGDLDGKS